MSTLRQTKEIRGACLVNDHDAKKAVSRSRKVAGAVHGRSREESNVVQLVGPPGSGERKPWPFPLFTFMQTRSHPLFSCVFNYNTCSWTPYSVFASSLLFESIISVDFSPPRFAFQNYFSVSLLWIHFPHSFPTSFAWRILLYGDFVDSQMESHVNRSACVRVFGVCVGFEDEAPTMPHDMSGSFSPRVR